MNNFLPLLLMLASGKGSGISAESLAPLIKSLGLGDSAVAPLVQGLFGTASDGPPSIEKLLPVLLGAIGSKSNGSIIESAKNDENKSVAQPTGSTTPNYLKPICDIASDSVNYALSHYFSNN
ncbi:MAG: hypothetical protein IJV67_07970 [Clostridia bacterium]|nr:hypothetical protein [Clostridia bacterium]